ncbi:MAG: PD40 domain-containing protein, partial [Anaerolineae bacterium]|nr:PD40 domain-containing protein [Anaerolineae bacterium]
QLAFEYTAMLPDGSFAPSVLAIMDVATGALRELTTLPGSAPGEVDLGSTIALAWSPDGTTLAASFFHQRPNQEIDGVYLIDVATGDMAQLYNPAELAATVADLVPPDSYLSTYPIRWSPDGTHLLLWPGNAGAYAGGVWPCVADLATGELTPVPLPLHPDDEGATHMVQPLQAVWSPDGQALLLLTNEVGTYPDETVEMLAGEAGSRNLGVRLIDLATGEMRLLGHLPANPAPWFEAAWGPEGHVLIANHYLALAYSDAAEDADAAPAAGAPAESTPATSLPVTAAPPIDLGTVTVTTARPPGFESNPDQRIYSPDGRYIFYTTREQLCRWDGALDQTECLDLPEGGLLPSMISNSRPFNPSAISPDGSRLAVVGGTLIYSSEGDLWIIDFTDESFTQLLDDGVPEGDSISSSGGNPAMTLPVQPAWSPDGTQIAFEYTTTLANGDFAPSTLAVLDVASGAVRELTTLPGSQPGEIDLGSTYGLAWSPDGTTLAASFRHLDPDNTIDGIYLVDVATGETTQLFSRAALAAAEQTIFPEGEHVAAYPLHWSPDGTRLLFWADHTCPGDFRCIWPFVADVTTGALLPVPLPLLPDSPPSIPTFSFGPLQAAWSPDGRALLVTTREAATYPGETIEMLVGEEGFLIVGVRLYDLETGEWRLLGHLPHVTAHWFTATWGPEGHVLINDHYLSLDYAGVAGAGAPSAPTPAK